MSHSNCVRVVLYPCNVPWHRRENTVRLRRMHLAYLAPELLASLPTSNQAAVSTHSLAYTRFTDVFAYGCARPTSSLPLFGALIQSDRAFGLL